MDLHPLNDLVVVRPEEMESQTDSGLHIPESAQSTVRRGTVVSIGPNVVGVKRDDYVIFPRHVGTPFDIDGESYLIIQEENFYAKLS